jgi:predicted metalloprotease
MVIELRGIASLLCVLCVCMLVSGCSGSDVAPTKDADFDGVADALDRCPGQEETRNKVFDFDGCPDDVADLYVPVRTDIEAYWTSAFPALYGRAYSPISRMQLFAGETDSVCAPARGPLYCSLDEVVYLETGFMTRQITNIGDFAGVFVIAHEVGHHIQNLRGIFNSTNSITAELQADCLAGAWGANVGARGLLAPGDYLEAARLMFEIGDPLGVPWFAPGAHGTPGQRHQAFSKGFRSGPGICE